MAMAMALLAARPAAAAGGPRRGACARARRRAARGDAAAAGGGGEAGAGVGAPSSDGGAAARPQPNRPRRSLLPESAPSFDFVQVVVSMSKVFVAFGVAAALAMAFFLFVTGFRDVMTQGWHAFRADDAHHLVLIAIEAMDHFLLGMVCLVFGLGSYELFFAPAPMRRPSWLSVNSIDDLETSLGQTLVAVMVVNVLEKAITMPYKEPMHLVFAAVAALLCAGALSVAHDAAKHKNGKKLATA